MKFLGFQNVSQQKKSNQSFFHSLSNYNIYLQINNKIKKNYIKKLLPSNILYIFADDYLRNVY